MSKLKLLEINSNMLVLIEHNFDFDNIAFKKPLPDRIKATAKIAKILQNEDSCNLYLNLRVVL